MGREQVLPAAGAVQGAARGGPATQATGYVTSALHPMQALGDLPVTPVHRHSHGTGALS